MVIVSLYTNVDTKYIFFLQKDVDVLNYCFWKIWADWKDRDLNLILLRTFTLSQVVHNMFPCLLFSSLV